VFQVLADPATDGTSKQFCHIRFHKKIALIGGTGYTGEKGIFSALNFILL
jgi:ATP-dependent phosphoenolpyruvate carboxykinase